MLLKRFINIVSSEKKIPLALSLGGPIDQFCKNKMIFFHIKHLSILNLEIFANVYIYTSKFDLLHWLHLTTFISGQLHPHLFSIRCTYLAILFEFKCLLRDFHFSVQFFYWSQITTHIVGRGTKNVKMLEGRSWSSSSYWSVNFGMW